MNKKEHERLTCKRGKRNKSREDVLKDREDEIFNIGREITNTEEKELCKKLKTKKGKLNNIKLLWAIELYITFYVIPTIGRVCKNFR